MRMITEDLKTELSVSEFLEGFVDIPRFAACCAECRGYGKTWACPPYEFDPATVWQGYERILLAGKKVYIPEGERRVENASKAAAELLAPVKSTLTAELYEMEKAEPGSLALFAGGCDICSECTRGKGEPCRFPERMRFSVESLGGNAQKVIEELFKVPLLWGENGVLPEYFVLLGALLKYPRS